MSIESALECCMSERIERMKGESNSCGRRCAVDTLPCYSEGGVGATSVALPKPIMFPPGLALKVGSGQQLHEVRQLQSIC